MNHFSSVNVSVIDESIISSQRDYEKAKLERSRAEQERARKEEELQKLKELALREQHELHEKRAQTLVDDFLRMKALTVSISLLK